MFTIIWKAVFDDGSEISQYGRDGKETLFKEVLDKQKDLRYFTLLNRNSNETFTVDLEKGCILKSKVIENTIQLPQPRADMLRKKDYEYRLIYFREVARTFNSNLEEVGDTNVVYFVGFQYTDENEKNHKRLIKIHTNGEWVVN